MIQPPVTPMIKPSTVSRRKTTIACDQPWSPASRNSTSSKVRKTAKGSLVPDSTSSVARTRGRSLRPRVLINKNTAAASVEATTAPTSSACIQEMFSASLAIGAVSSVVISTPTVASVVAGASTLRKVAKRVRRPPSNRISASAIEPTV